MLVEQNINLLHGLPSDRSSKYTGPQFLLLILGGFLGLLLLIYFVNFWLYKNAQSNLMQLLVTKDAVTKQVVRLKKQLGVQDVEEDGSKAFVEVKRLRFSKIGFSSYLEELAQYAPYGIWLNGVSFDLKMGMLSFMLNGKTLSTALLSRFIKTIEQHHVFGKIDFISLRLQKNEKDNFASFTLSNSK